MFCKTFNELIEEITFDVFWKILGLWSPRGPLVCLGFLIIHKLVTKQITRVRISAFKCLVRWFHERLRVVLRDLMVSYLIHMGSALDFYLVQNPTLFFQNSFNIFLQKWGLRSWTGSNLLATSYIGGIIRIKSFSQPHKKNIFLKYPIFLRT
jgi:hypothetical protein